MKIVLGNIINHIAHRQPHNGFCGLFLAFSTHLPSTPTIYAYSLLGAFSCSLELILPPAQKTPGYAHHGHVALPALPVGLPPLLRSRFLLPSWAGMGMSLVTVMVTCMVTCFVTGKVTRVTMSFTKKQLSSIN